MKTLWVVVSVILGILQADAIPVTIQPQAGNIVLTWPSSASQTYIVQYKQTLDTNNTWQTLEANLQGNDGTTSYMDSNQVPVQAAGMVTQNKAIIVGAGRLTSGQTAESIDLEDLLPPMPPMPWDMATDTSSLQTSPSGATLSDMLSGVPDPGTGGTNTSGGGSGVPPTYRFYRVVQNGVSLLGITNGMVLSDYVWLPVEFANGSGTISSISLLDDGVPVPNSVLTPPFDYPIGFAVDTLLLSNCVHQFTASAEWNDTNGGRWEAESAPIAVSTANEVTFENWMPAYGETGDSLLIRATSAHLDTEWWIDVYSITNGNYHYIGTFEGHTYDGDIAATWGLVGPNGESYSSAQGFAFEVATEYVDPPTPPTYRVTDPWTGWGAWAIACQHAWDDCLDKETLYSELSGLVKLAQGLNWDVFPPPDRDGNPYALHFSDSGDPQGDTDWAAFRSALYNPATRNLVYFGHGGETGLGRNTANTNRFISATEIASMLNVGQTNRHNFRFVFVDACATSEGGMPEAFGVLHRENVNITDYMSASMRPSAYAGWPKDKMIGLLQGKYPNYNHINFMIHIQYEMIGNNKGIKQAIRDASRYPDISGFGENDIKVYGYWGLTVGGYNR